MYNSFFEIDYPPFSISQDLNYLYLNKKLKEILDGLRYACNTKEGIIKLTGDVGSGKTIICKALANELKDNFLVINIHPAEIKSLNILEVIDSKLLENNIDSFLQKKIEISKNTIKNRVLIIFDDYLKITEENLNRIIYANENIKSTSLLTFLLISNNFENKKITNVLKKINDRVIYHFDMPKLSKDDTIDYINHRLKIAGYKNNQVELFSKKICSLVYEKSNGLPRKINILCDKCLISAFLNQRKFPSRKDFQSAIKSTYIDTNNKSLFFKSYNFFFISIFFVISLTIIFTFNRSHKSEKFLEAETIVENEKKEFKNNLLVDLDIDSLNEKIISSLSEINKTDNSFSTILISIHFDPQKIFLFIKDYKDFFEKNNFLIYKTIIANKNGYCITFGKFDNLSSAQKAIIKLPQKILDNKPYIRTFGGIKKEIKGTIVQEISQK